jgi:DNA-binding transcriptional regulator YiaG
MESENQVEKFKELVAQVANSNEEVAQFLGVSVRTVYRWLSGQTKIPQPALRALQLIASKG